MKNFKILFVLIIILSTSGIFAQQIEIGSKPWESPKFYQDSVRHSLKDMAIIMQENPAVLNHIQQARTNNTFVKLFTYTGGVLMGYPMAIHLSGGVPQWAIALTGGGLIALSVPFFIATNKHSHLAVKLYNEQSTSEKPSVGYNFSFNFIGNGVSLAFHF